MPLNDDPSLPYIDWRHRNASRLAEDLPAAFPGGPAHKAGAPITLASVTSKDRRGNLIALDIPSPVALALNISLRSAATAEQIRSAFTEASVSTPYGDAKGVAYGQATALFDFFEYAMLSASFSYNAIEVFSNQSIADLMTKPMQLTREGKPRIFDLEDTQRYATTEEKVLQILPVLYQVDPPSKVHSEWSDFKRLKRTRDSTIHLKADESYRRGTLDHKSFYYDLYNTRSISLFPATAISVIRYFFAHGGVEPTWLAGAQDHGESIGVLKPVKAPPSAIRPRI